MNQISFADAEYAGKRKKTRREVFLDEMEQVVPWKLLLKVIEPFYPVAGNGRRPYPLATMLRAEMPMRRSAATSRRRASTRSSIRQRRKTALAVIVIIPIALWKRSITAKVRELRTAISRDGQARKPNACALIARTAPATSASPVVPTANRSTRSP